MQTTLTVKCFKMGLPKKLGTGYIFINVWNESALKQETTREFVSNLIGGFMHDTTLSQSNTCIQETSKMHMTIH